MDFKNFLGTDINLDSGIFLKSEKSKIMTEKYKFHEDIKNSLIENIKKNGDLQNYTTNAQCYMTDWKMNLNYDSFKILEKWILNVFEYRYSKFAEKNKFFIHDMWGLIYKKNDFSIPHDHLPFFLSFVYYVSSPKGSPPIIFKSSNYKIYPEDGKLILFPSSLIHYVPKQKINNERICIAGNIHFSI